MRIIVIGGTGFIGRHVVRHLVDLGHDVAVFHRGGREPDLPIHVRHLHGNRERFAAYLREFRQFAPDVVLLMALPQGNDHTAKDFVTSFKGIARRSVVTTSRDVYRAFNRLHRLELGPPDPVPLTEQSPLREKLYPYRTLVKDPAWHDYDDILVEHVVLGAPDIPATVLRLPVVYGPEDQHFHRTFPYLRRMDDGRPAILLDTERAQHRDSRVYVEDAAWAVALAATDERAKGRIYNVAPTRTLTEIEWVKSIARAAAWQGQVVVLPRERLPKHLVRDLDFRHDLALSSERIRDELGYSERIPFEIGLQKTLEWQRANLPNNHPSLFDYEAEDAALKAIGI
jgi:nucleoside-diphosphate-sugar epimerase